MAALRGGSALGTQLPSAAARLAVEEAAAAVQELDWKKKSRCHSSRVSVRGGARQAAATPEHPVMRQLDGVPADERDFWLRLLAADPRVRLTVDAALAHPFLRD